MSPELEEFKLNVIAHSKLVASRAPRVDSEASTNTSLVQPFLRLLGYDVGNPDEVSPEHHADFSEKYQNKVDYAILNKGNPVIALESKRVGSQMKDDRGQLRSYFNACPSVKLGILTDGLRYEFFADSDKPNMMDDNAFLRLNFSEIAKDTTIDENALSGLAAIRNGLFNPENVGAEAKQKLLFESIITILKKMKSEPNDEYIRFLLRQSDVGNKFGNLTQKIVDTNRDLIRSAIDAFVAQEALARLGFEPKDVVRTPAEQALPPASVPQEAPTEGLQPSVSEMHIFDYSRNRLYFLIRNEELFQEVQKIYFRKSQKSFRVYYSRPNSGSLFDYWEQKDGTRHVSFPALGANSMPYSTSKEFDEALLKAFQARTSDPKAPKEPPVLRSIQGGQGD